MIHLKDEILIDYMENELSETDKNSVMEHITTCHLCAKKLEEYQLTFSILARHEVPAVPSEKWATFLPHIYQKLEKPSLLQKILSVFDFRTSPAKFIVPSLTMILAIALMIVFLNPNPELKKMNLEQIVTVAQKENQIDDIQSMIDEDISNLGNLTENVSVDVLTKDVSLDSETESIDISSVIDDKTSEKVEYMDEMIYENMDFNDILDNLTDEELEQVIQELEKKSDKNQYKG